MRYFHQISKGKSLITNISQYFQIFSNFLLANDNKTIERETITKNLDRHTKLFGFFPLFFNKKNLELTHILLHMTGHKCKKHEKLFSILLSNMHKKALFPFYERLFYTNNGSSEYNNKIVFLLNIPTPTKWLYWSVSYTNATMCSYTLQLHA